MTLKQLTAPCDIAHAKRYGKPTQQATAEQIASLVGVVIKPPRDKNDRVHPPVNKPKALAVPVAGKSGALAGKQEQSPHELAASELQASGRPVNASTIRQHMLLKQRREQAAEVNKQAMNILQGNTR